MNWEVPIILIILFIPTFLLIRWVLKKLNFRDKNQRKYIAIISSAILTPLIYFVLVIIWIFSISYYPQKAFDKQKWHENIEERYKMSNDVIKSEMLIGKTKEEVIELLGDDFYSYNDSCIHYELGFVPGLFSIDPDVLDVYFKNGKVVRVGQHET